MAVLKLQCIRVDVVCELGGRIPTDEGVDIEHVKVIETKVMYCPTTMYNFLFVFVLYCLQAHSVWQ